jgi:SAM-dependent methyltransferase
VADKVTFLVGNACELPVDSESVSCVFSCESAFHYEDKDGFVRESYRVLRKGGLLLIADIVRTARSENLQCAQILRDFGRMLSASHFFTLEDYKKHISDAGFKRIIDCEVIGKHNLGYLGAYSARLINIYALLDKLPGLKIRVKKYLKKRQINIDNFIEHSRTTAEAVKLKLVDYIVISAQK